MMMKSAPRPVNDSAHRGRQPITVGRGDKLFDRLLLRREPGGECPSIPIAGHYTATLSGEFVGQVLGVANTQQLGCGIVAQDPRRKCNGGRQRFKTSGRNVDYEPSELSLAAVVQL